MGNCRLNAWFAKLKLKALTKSATNHKISEIPTHDKQPQPPPPSSTTSSFVSSSSASSSSSSSSCGAVPDMASNKTGQLPYFSHQRKSYYFTRDLSTPPPPPPPPPPTATLYLYDDNASISTTRCPKNSHLSQPPRETSSSKKKRVAAGRRNRASIFKSHHKPSPRLVSTGVLRGCKASSTIESLWTKPPDLSPQVYPQNSAAETSSDDESMLPEICSSFPLSPEKLDDSVLSWSSVSSCRCRVGKKDALINAENNACPLTSKLNYKSRPKQQLDGFTGSASGFGLPQIRTNISRKSCSTGEEYIMDRGNKNEASEQRGVGAMVKGEDILSTNSYVSLSSGKVGERRTNPGAARRFSSVNNSAGGGVKLRTRSPRIANKRMSSQARKSLSSCRGRRSVSESLAVVKSSKDPQRDFRASMVEMIVENEICGAKDLEDLLACYLCLNSNEYHELIIGVFKQIWFYLVEHCNH